MSFEVLHPIFLVKEIINKYGDGLSLKFSKYLYEPGSVFDVREDFSIEASHVTLDWFGEMEANLVEEWELAQTSIVISKDGRERHLGMIDFIGRPPLHALLDGVRTLLGPEILGSLYIFDSGRSYHGYVCKLMNVKKWRDFQYRLLLMNKVGQVPIIDSRWVAHRLLGGYSSLRWSAESHIHSEKPKLIWPKVLR